MKTETAFEDTATMAFTFCLGHSHSHLKAIFPDAYDVEDMSVYCNETLKKGLLCSRPKQEVLMLISYLTLEGPPSVKPWV